MTEDHRRLETSFDDPPVRGVGLHEDGDDGEFFDDDPVREVRREDPGDDPRPELDDDRLNPDD